MTIQGIAHVQVSIPPAGEREARRFYGRLLGLEEIPKPAALADRGGCWFRCGPQELHCGVDPAAAPGRWHPALLTDDLDELRDRLERSGVHVREDRQIPGYRRFYADDPFGNRIELLQRIDGS